VDFALGRSIDGATQDVQSAINAAGSTLPRNLPYPPTYAKVNPADAPIVTLALTSPTIPLRQLSDLDGLQIIIAGDGQRAEMRQVSVVLSRYGSPTVGGLLGRRYRREVAPTWSRGVRAHQLGSRRR